MIVNGAVAAEVVENGLKLFFHGEGKTFREETIPFSPWCLAAADVPAPEGVKEITLQGNGALKKRFEFPTLTAYENASELFKQPGVMKIRDLLQQALSITGIHFFSGMSFQELRRMQFTVTTADDGTIARIAVADDDGMRELNAADGGERRLLEFFNYEIISADPDVLEGYNCCREALPLLEARAKKLKFKFTCGRDGGGFTMRRSRFTVAEKQISYNRFSICGRSIIDLLHTVQFYDAVHRDFESFDLSAVKEYFSLADGDDTAAIRELGNLLSPAWFYKCASLPLGYQECMMRGSGSALDALLIAEYQKQDHSIPFPEESRRFAGALTGMETPGVFHNVRHCDVRSLYPSLLLHFRRDPARDELGIFLSSLEKLRTFRLEAKDRARSLPPGKEKVKFDALQSSFKILINSFYGYLGFAQGTFNDYALAEHITASGRELLGKLINQLTASGALIAEMDTDGIYFCMPEQPEDDFDDKLRAVLPAGIELEFDAEYQAMYCYKAKNYALLNRDGTISVSGAALKSRALENFQRQVIFSAVKSKLLNDDGIFEDCVAQTRRAIEERTIPLTDLAKSEVLNDSPESYRRKQGQPGFRRSAAYELALGSDKQYRAGDKVRFYMTGTKAKLPVVGNSKLLEDADENVRDENIAWYLAKLDELYKTFR